MKSYNILIFADLVFITAGRNKKAQAVYYSVIKKNDGHLRKRGKCQDHEPQASAFYITSDIFGYVFTLTQHRF